MIQKEVTEIKNTLKYTDCSIHKIAGCYVDTNKMIHIVSHEQFLCLPEEDQHKYFAIIKKGLSGKVGKNLINLSFDSNFIERRDYLLDLVKSELADEDKVNSLFETIRDSYPYVDNYYIMAVYGAYDVPGVSTDGIEMDDASDEVYKFVLTLICPMKPSKAGLTYNEKDNILENAVRNLMVEDPMHGFLFPSFNNRGTDIHNLLFYSKKADAIEEGFIGNLFGCKAPATAKKQNEVFLEAVSTIETLTFENAVNICTRISEKEEASQVDEDKMVISERETVNMLEASGVKSEDLETFKKTLKDATDETRNLLTSNIIEQSNKLHVHTGITEIYMPMDHADNIEVQKINGKNCIVIEINDELTVNGIKVNNFKNLEI